MIEGQIRYHCPACKTIHYQNPKPTATLICIKDNQILLAKRAFEPAKGSWALPGGFIELGETPEQAAKRELKEETNLNGEVVKLLGHCSHFNSIFGDILLIGMLVKIIKWDKLQAGDDVSEVKLFNINNCPDFAFKCHEKIFLMYKNLLQ
tara:strand:- start:3307 stop:3756 length:450 start_codon:yes stop_codon:yes gene_type:complete